MRETYDTILRLSPETRKMILAQIEAVESLESPEGGAKKCLALYPTLAAEKRLYQGNEPF